MADPGRPLRVLLSEGSSTSAREAITALGLAGHTVEVCDPDRFCLARFSRFVRRLHRCPPLSIDPAGFLAFVRDLLTREHFDVLLPIHEQGYLFAKVQSELWQHAALALPSFESYAAAHSKASFSRILSELDLPQPVTTFVASPEDARAAARFPIALKSALGTAGRGTFIVRDAAEMERALSTLAAQDAFADIVLVQEFVTGPVEHAQAVFARGELVAMHAYRQIARGAGGGPAAKESVHRPAVRAHLARIGAHLSWHGALSVDYILADTPRYIDCNPRLVEPMSAYLAGLDLVDLLLRVSLDETPQAVPEPREGVRTHLAIQALLGCALAGGSRREILRECWRLLTHRGLYAGSLEELTPAHIDWPSALPATATAAMLLMNPSAAHRLPERFGPHLLTPRSIRAIQAMQDAAPRPFSIAG